MLFVQMRYLGIVVVVLFRVIRGTSLWQVVTWVTGYHIWKERNNRVFGAKASSVNKNVQYIKLQSFKWIVRREKKTHCVGISGSVIQLIVNQIF